MFVVFYANKGFFGRVSQATCCSCCFEGDAESLIMSDYNRFVFKTQNWKFYKWYVENDSQQLNFACSKIVLLFFKQLKIWFFLQLFCFDRVESACESYGMCKCIGVTAFVTLCCPCVCFVSCCFFIYDEEGATNRYNSCTTCFTGWFDRYLKWVHTI